MSKIYAFKAFAKLQTEGIAYFIKLNVKYKKVVYQIMINVVFTKH